MTSTGFIDSLVLIWKSGVGITVTSQTLGSLAYPVYTSGKSLHTSGCLLIHPSNIDMIAVDTEKFVFTAFVRFAYHS